MELINNVIAYLSNFPYIMIPLGILLLAVADRWRGDHKNLADFLGSPWKEKIGRTLDKVVYGWLVACFVAFPFELGTLYIILGMVIGMSFGWGEPIGAALEGREMDQTKLERWQVGPLKTNAWLALVARGVIWDVMMLAGISFALGVVVLAPIYTIALPAAILLTNLFERPNAGNWEHQEYLRGALAGLMLVTVPAVIF